MSTKSSRAQLYVTLRVMLHDVFRLRSEGAAYARLARAHGYVDGYMRALLEAGLVDQKELLAVVAEERRAVDGPLTGPVASDNEEAHAAVA